jgi:hypothetical protein
LGYQTGGSNQNGVTPKWMVDKLENLMNLGTFFHTWMSYKLRWGYLKREGLLWKIRQHGVISGTNILGNPFTR